MEDDTLKQLLIKKGYSVQEVIGVGAFAEVHRAVFKKKEVAVKISREQPVVVKREVEIMAKLRHKNIIHMLDAFYGNKNSCIVMELCPRSSLESYLTDCVPENQAQIYVQQLASAIRYMRSKQVSHFDLKPENILVTMSPKVVLKIGDFGLAQFVHDDELLRGHIGTSGYMAPEIVLTETYGPKADLWSFGALIYEILFFKTFVDTTTMHDILLNPNLNISFPSEPTVSDSCKELMRSLLKSQPSERISFNDFYAHEFINLDPMPTTMTLRKRRHQ